MFANETSSYALGRRALLGFAAVAAAAPLLARGAFADPAPAEATATIDRFSAALLGAMKAGKQTSFQARYQMLAPAVEQAFDLPAVLAVSVGPRWSSLPADQQSRLLDAFRRYTVASYVANFDSYKGQSFSVSPDARTLGSGEVVVSSRIT
jgi:phospholipid transport system substrate-binding protein